MKNTFFEEQLVGYSSHETMISYNMPDNYELSKPQTVSTKEYSTVYSVKTLFWLTVSLAGSFSEKNIFKHFLYLLFLCKI